MLAGGLLAAAVGALVAAAVLLPPAEPGLNTSLHQHVHIEVVVRGVAVPIPVNIGIDPALWNDHSLDAYGGMSGMSPVHTHEGDGTVHLEFGQWHPATLGDFFRIWGQPFGEDRLLDYQGPVTMTVGGEPNAEYGNLVLQDGQHIVVRGG